ncbi:MAG: protein kinase, partial [Planctomycetes bacterium]|nr:protein kinase [Planctomycetota bacterium]
MTSDPSRTAPASPTGSAAVPPASEPATAATLVAGPSTAATQVATSGPAEAATVVTHGIDALPPGAPKEIGGVRLRRVLGKGAMGEVYLGRHATMDVDVAVKLMTTAAGDGERFLQEVRTAAKISHPNVVQVLNAGTQDGHLFLVMELVTGGDVAQLVRRDGRVPWRRAVDLMTQAAEGLGAAHRAGIVHRDVKPANFLLTGPLAGEGRLKVADLGLAKHQHATDVELTQAGVVMGTPAYMAPEQAVDSRRAGPPADIYALGVSLFHLLSGRLPYEAPSTT